MILELLNNGTEMLEMPPYVRIAVGRGDTLWPQSREKYAPVIPDQPRSPHIPSFNMAMQNA